MTRLTREDALAQAQEVVEILRVGAYAAPSGRRVAIDGDVARARAGTVAYPPGREVSAPAPAGHATRIRVERTTTLDAARRLVGAGKRPAALDFANATVPGGGFLVGALAQEEALCRASGLFACLRDDAMYAYHRERADVLYTDYVLYTPRVPVFRDEDGRLLEEPWPLAFLTSAAPLATLYRHGHPDRVPDLERAFRTRIPKVLGVAAEQGHAELVLGAWGCGEFGNDPAMVAACFRDALEGPFRGVFTDVVFAIADGTPDRRVGTPFEAVFGSPRRGP